MTNYREKKTLCVSKVLGHSEPPEQVQFNYESLELYCGTNAISSKDMFSNGVLMMAVEIAEYHVVPKFPIGFLLA